MNWFTWLSKTGLDSSLVYKYGLSFIQNEIEIEDMEYFNHEFLLSMGISIAKHRLEILKLARNERGSISYSTSLNDASTLYPISKLFVAIKKTKTRVANYFHTWTTPTSCHDEKAIMVVPTTTPSRDPKWKKGLLKRNFDERFVMGNNSKHHQRTLLLTNGNYSPMLCSNNNNNNNNNNMGTPRVKNFTSPAACSLRYDRKIGSDDDDGYWSAGVEEIRWDTMFQNLRPT